MPHKSFLGYVFLVISLSLIISGFFFSTTGNVINSSQHENLTLRNILGLVFFFLGLVLLAQREALEYLVIPIGGERWEKPRIKAARHAIEQGHIDKIVLTGDINSEKEYLRHPEKYGNRGVYRELRKEGIKPGQMRILKGMDSEEDVLYLGQFVKPGDTVRFDTFPLHFREYSTLIKKAQRDGKFPKNVALKNARIPQGRKETAYGILGWMEEVFKRRPLDYKKNRKSDALDSIKGIVKKVIGA
jgi:hypothetical protein